MPFFDFHIHPTLKSLFSDEDATAGLSKLSPWQPLDTRNIPPLIKCCSDLSDILASQSNLAQLCNNDCNLVCVALYVPENDILVDEMIKQAEEGRLGVYLQQEKINKILHTKAPPDTVTEDLDTLTNPLRFGITDKKVKLIRSRSEYDETDLSTLHVVCSVEGCHTVSSTLQSFDTKGIIDNLEIFRKKVSLLAINLTHMENSPLCNQAYGMQFLSNEGFKPVGKGLAAPGLEVLEYCYTNRIMIDIKHLSLVSRQDLYALRKTPAYQSINQPVICTHAGFTGISIKEIPDYLDFQPRKTSGGYAMVRQGKPVKYGKDERPSFNASSINLYDEDIFEILSSDGIIGISMDRRILGYQKFEDINVRTHDFPLETEYVSNHELDFFLTAGQDIQTVKIGSAFEDDKCLGWDEIYEEGQVNPSLGEHHTRYFMAHILHMIKVARQHNLDVNKVLTQVCIGSDFDGLINPIAMCYTIDGIAYFKSQVERDFVAFAEEAGVALPEGFDVKNFSNQLFFENGRDFVLTRLDILNS